MFEEPVSEMLRLQQRIASGIAVAAGRPAIQPDFAEAYAALALAQLQFLFGGPLSPHEAIPKAEAAARKAIELDDTLPRAHLALGQILILYHWRLEEGYKELDRANELPGTGLDDTVGGTSALRRRGRFEEAIAVAERRRDRDPLSVGAQIVVGTSYRAAGQHDRALEELRKALDMSPGNTRAHHLRGITFLAMRRWDDAIRELEISARPATGHSSRMEAHLGYAYAAAGRAGDARAVLKELDEHRAEGYVSWFGTALVHDALGERSRRLRRCDARTRITRLNSR
ncbi:MAG TPA: tetratricopeptide repeat protein [Gemmatimonadaceae bacterium]|nr:tetratricopeptide repeat protein [Gemmatimonadaceae bacterium]